MGGRPGADQIPRLVIVFDIDDPKAFGKVLDQAMVAANASSRPRPPQAAAGRPRPGRRPGWAVGPVPRVPLMPGETKTYTSGRPARARRPVPASFRPAIRIGKQADRRLATPRRRRGSLWRRKPTWAPRARSAQAFGNLPANVTSLETRTLPTCQAPGHDPGGLQHGDAPSRAANAVRMLIAGEARAACGRRRAGRPRPAGGPGRPGAGARRGRSGPPPRRWSQVDAAKLPSADSIRPCFPVALHGRGGRRRDPVRRRGRPSCPSPTRPMLRLRRRSVLPAAKAARDAARGGPPAGMALRAGLPRADQPAGRALGTPADPRAGSRRGPAGGRGPLAGGLNSS